MVEPSLDYLAGLAGAAVAVVGRRKTALREMARSEND